MSEALGKLYASVSNRIQMDFDTFCQAVSDWKIVPLEENGKVIGAVMEKANEVHIGYGDVPKASIRGHLRKTLKQVLNDYGCAITFVQKDNKRGLDFCKRLGFVEKSLEKDKIRLECKESKYV